MSDPLLEVAVDAATRAGELLRSRFGALRQISYKGSRPRDVARPEHPQEPSA